MAREELSCIVDESVAYFFLLSLTDSTCWIILFFILAARSQIRLLHSLSCYLYIHVAISSTQMFPWCPHWCRHPTAAVWRSVLTDSLWIWTRRSTNTTTSAHTHAPCWTLSSDQSITKTDPIRSSFRQWRWFPVYLLKLWPMGRCFRLECLKKTKKPGPGIVMQLGALAQDHPVLLLWCCLEGISQYSQYNDSIR